MVKKVQLLGTGQTVELSTQAELAQGNQGLVIAQPSDRISVYLAEESASTMEVDHSQHVWRSDGPRPDNHT